MPELNLKFKHHLPGDALECSPGKEYLVCHQDEDGPHKTYEKVEWHPVYRYLRTRDYPIVDGWAGGVTDDFWYAELTELEVPAV